MALRVKAPQQIDFPGITTAGYRFLLDLARWVNDLGIIYRGDPNSADFDETILTTNGVWQTGPNALDLASIVPVGTRGVLVRVTVNDGAAGSVLILKQDGQTNDLNSMVIRTQAVDITNDETGIVFISSSLKMAYWASNLTFTSIGITILGWFK